MAIMSATASFTRFLVQDPVKKDFWDFVDKGLKAGGFKPTSEDRSESGGFASWEDLFDSSFDFASYHKAEYVAFRFRVDRRKVPSLLLKHDVKEAVLEHRERNDGKWPSRQEKAQIREDVVDRLLALALPQPSVCDVVWNTQANWLLVGTTGKKMLEAVHGHLESHLQLYPVPLMHAQWAETLLAPGSPEQAALQGLVPPQSGDSLAEGRALGYDFLTWLWYFAETTGGRLPLPDNREVEIQPGEHLVLSHPDNGRERIVCTTPAVSLHEARTGLQQGKRVEQIQIYMKVGENEYFLKLDTDLWALRGVKTPRQERDPGEDEEDGLFLERMYFLEEIFAGLDAAYGSFLSQRLGEQWDRKVRPKLNAWFEETS